MRRPLVYRYRTCEAGVTAVEFALLAVPLFVLIFGGMELAYQSALRATLQGALNDAARRATVESPLLPGSPTGNMTQRIEELIESALHPLAPEAVVSISPRSYYEFSGVGRPETYVDVNKNGRYDPSVDCYYDANRNNRYDTDSGSTGLGLSNEVVFYKADLTAPRLIPFGSFLPIGEKIQISLTTSVRNQPYDNLADIPLKCPN